MRKVTVMTKGFHGAAFAKQPRGLGDPISPASDNPHFEALPPFTATNLTLPLGTILPGVGAEIENAGRLVFHALGDTGGIHGTETEIAVATAMQDQIVAAAGDSKPRFMFHLGDVVYYNGLSIHYREQFYEPFQFYDAPIFAIPGNHDGDSVARRGDEPDTESSLYGFMLNFCSPQPSNIFKHRTTMTQPYCFWKLDAPLVQIIGLYSNIDGQLDARGTYQQQGWLVEQLKTAPSDKWVILAVHHPCYSLDSTHGGYPEILSALDSAFHAGKRTPDVILSGHVHNYQRFSREFNGVQLPYLVAGAGGYANSARSLHKLQRGLEIGQLPYQTTRDEVALEGFDVQNSGFLRVTAEPGQLSVDYFSVSFDDPAVVSHDPIDSVVVRAKSRKSLVR